MVWFNGFALGQVSKKINGSVWSLSNQTEPLPIVSRYLNEYLRVSWFYLQPRALVDVPYVLL